jgi:hypothetical protein
MMDDDDDDDDVNYLVTMSDENTVVLVDDLHLIF